MRNRGAIIVFGLAVVGAIGLWVYQRGGSGSDSAATGSATGSASAGSSGTPAIQPVTADARPASLEVRVRTSAGPLAGAQVRIAAQDAEVIVAQTDERGVAFVKDLPPATYDISASAKGHVPSAQEQVLAAGQQASLELVLAAGGRSLAGLVTDVSGGPVAGARIDAAKLGGMARPTTAIATAFTGADGRYQLTVPEGALLVAARSTDYAPQSRYVDVGPSGATADFALVPGGVIEGVVLDEQTKQPIGGAAVQAWRDAPAMMLAEPGGRRVLAGVDGRFRLTGLRPGAYELGARGNGRVSRAPTIVGLGVAEQVTDVTLLVGRGAVVRGTVVDETNAPVASATVTTLSGGRGSDVTTDAKGAFEIEGVAPGKHVLVARADEHVSAGLVPVEVKEADVSGVVVHVQRGVRVRGHVEPRQPAQVSVELEGRRGPGPGPMLMIGPTSIATKDDGSFELPPLMPGAAKLSARGAAGDQGSVDIAIAAGMPEVTIKLSPGGSITGRVIDAEGKPVPAASVMAAPTGGEERTTIVNGMITSGTQAITGANGAFELRGLAAGTYRLSVLERGQPLRPRSAVAPVKLAANEKKTGVELAVDRSNGVIKGVVTGPDGKPLADAWVSAAQDLRSLVEGLGGGGPGGPPGEGGSRMVMIEAQDDDAGDGGGGLAPVLTDAQGQFTITGLPAGSFDVIAEAQAGKLRGRVDNVRPDATISIKALGVTTLSGTVRGPAGPASLFTIELDGPTRTQRSFTGGTFQLGRVDPGDYTVRVTSSEGNAEAKVTVVPDTPATVDLVLVANAIVVGQVVGTDGKPVVGVDVAAIADSGDGRIQISIEGPPPTTGPDGRFRIEREAGKAAIVVLTPPRPTIKRGLVLEAGKTLDVGVIQLEQAPPPKP